MLLCPEGECSTVSNPPAAGTTKSQICELQVSGQGSLTKDPDSGGR